MKNVHNKDPNDTVVFLRDEADNWGMGDDHEEGQVALPPFFDQEELARLDPGQLIDHCLNLQRVCAELDGDNKVAHWELREANDYMLRLARVAQLAHYINSSDLDSVVDLATNDLPQYLNCGFAAFYLYDQAASQFELYHSTQPVGDAKDSTRGRGHGQFLAHLFRSREEPFLIEYIGGSYKIDASSECLTMFKAPKRWHNLLGDTAIVFPLITRPPEGEPVLLGGLIVGKSDGRLTEKEAEMAMMFVDLLSSSLYNAQLVRQLNRMATTDVLTGLFNRRHFLAEMEKAIAHALRAGQPLSIAMIDIDHFKRFNDVHGHLCGDMVLAETGALLDDTIRKKVDIAARYGGEEFVVIMPYTRIDQALSACERIRQAVEEKEIQFEGKTMRITCSLGVAEYIPGEGLNVLIDRADAALYRAKENGRNQVAALASGATDG